MAWIMYAKDALYHLKLVIGIFLILVSLTLMFKINTNME